MKIYSVEQISEIDRYTIAQEPITSIDLMERASSRLVEWIIERLPSPDLEFNIFCGPGNNGGDGLAVSRMLLLHNNTINVYCLHIGQSRSPDNETNFLKLPTRSYLKVYHIYEKNPLPELSSDSVTIDAIFGSGLNRPVIGYWSKLIDHVNRLPNHVLSIDMPSGLMADKPTKSNAIVANHTLSLQTVKLAMLLPENHNCVGTWHIIDIGLHKQIQDELQTTNHLITHALVKDLLSPRSKFSHKGTYGHAILFCGGFGKIGAAILAAKACLRSGVGLLTLHVPKCAYQVVQTAVPEAMVDLDKDDSWFTDFGNIDKYKVVGVGCGIGTKATTGNALKKLMDKYHSPMVLDADAINLLAKDLNWLDSLPPYSVLTPHPGEYKRLMGSDHNSFDRLERQKSFSRKHQVFVVLKGAHTCISTPTGEAYFNSTGNPGMATAGSGDVLTGIITGLLCQGLAPQHACLLGVYVHGLAGDIAAREIGECSMIASDIIEYLGQAFKTTISQE